MLSTRSNRLTVTTNGREALTELFKWNLKKKQESEDLLAAKSIPQASWKKKLVKARGPHLFPRDTGTASNYQGSSSVRMPSADIKQNFLHEQRKKNSLISSQFSQIKPTDPVHPPNKNPFWKDSNKTDAQRLYTTERQKLSCLGIPTGLNSPAPDPNHPLQAPRHRRFASEGDPSSMFGTPGFKFPVCPPPNNSTFRINGSSH
jgi:hypothetical protein